MLEKQGWRKVIVLSFPSDLVPQQASLDQTIRIPIESTEASALQTLINTIREQEGEVQAFIHLHPGYDAVPPLHDPFPENEKEIIKSVYFISKHIHSDLLNADPSSRACFLTVTRLNGRLGFGSPAPERVAGGGLYGLLKTANIEWESVYCRAVDFTPGMDEKEIARKLEGELYDPDVRLTEVGYHPEGRQTLLAETRFIDPGSLNTAGIGKDDLFLVSGGAKGVTATCLKELAKRCHPRFIIVGRSRFDTVEPEWAQGVSDDTALKTQCMEALKAEGEKPTPVKIANRLKPILARREIEQTLSQLQGCGSAVTYLSADISDPKELKKQLQPVISKFGDITGIIHGAGVLADKHIADKNEPDYHAVISTKVDGLSTLLQCVELDTLKHLVLFSSAAGFYGNEAQSDYAMANEMMNKLAQRFKATHPHCHVIAFNWGPWDGGMVTPELKRLFEERGIKVIPPDIGSSIMVDELCQTDHAVSQLVVGSSMVIPRQVEMTPAVCTITRTLDPRANPFLQDHIIGDESVLPIICALAWMADSCEKLYPGYHLKASRDTRVLKGLVFKKPTPVDIHTSIERLECASEDSIQCKVTVFSGSSEKPVYHYRSVIELSKQHVDTTLQQLPDTTAGEIKEGKLFYNDGTLFHGPTFQLVNQQLNIDTQTLTLLCKAEPVQPGKQGQFPVNSFNPYADDAQLQALLIWARQQFDAGSLPLAIQEARFYQKTPFDVPFYVSLKVTSANQSKLIADIVAHDQNGTVYTQLIGAEATVSKSLTEKFLKQES